MSPSGCPNCGAVAGFIAGPSGEVLSCVNCARISDQTRKSEERSACKDDIDKGVLTAARRSTAKDTIDLGAKIAAVALAAAALAKSRHDEPKPDAEVCTPQPPIPVRAVLPLDGIELEFGSSGDLQRGEFALHLSKAALSDLVRLAKSRRTTVTEILRLSVSLLQIADFENRMGHEIAIIRDNGEFISKILLPEW